jgi:hypothetical protein
MSNYNIIIFGASYGSLLATKLALAGHNVVMICLPHEVQAFNNDGAIVRMPVRDVEGLVEVNSKQLKGQVKACLPCDVTPSNYDLVVLAMQEPQYSAVEISDLLTRVAVAGVPCMSIMNMPPLTYLSRIPGLDIAALRPCYLSPEVWDRLDPGLMTLCSPDPQAFRPPDEGVNVLQVRLPTNFKSACFADKKHTAMLKDLERDVEAARFSTPTHQNLSLPVKLKVHDSVFVPLAKWAMLMAGNYRCVQKEAMRPIQEAVHHDLKRSRGVYEWVVDLCMTLGGDASDFVPFEKYAEAARSLGSPSSAARALAAGAKNIERVDKLVQTIGKSLGKNNDEIDASVALVDAWLEKNRTT